MTTKKRALIATLAGALVWGSAARGEIGPYVGASVGQTRVDVGLGNVEGVGLRIEDEDFAWKVFVGVELLGPLAIEGGYRDLGRVTDANDLVQASAESDGLDVFAVGRLPLGPVSLFAKGGVIAWDSEVQTKSGEGLGIPDVRLADSGTDLAWGVGVKVEVWKIAVRGEFERFEIDLPDDLTMLSVGVSIDF